MAKGNRRALRVMLLKMVYTDETVDSFARYTPINIMVYFKLRFESLWL